MTWLAVLKFLRSGLGQAVIGCVMLLLVAALVGWGLLALKAQGYRDGVASMAPKLEAANRDLRQCRSNTAGLSASLTAQNAAIEAARRAGDEMRAKSVKAVSEAHSAVAVAERRANTILAKRPVGADACQRALEADDLILGGVK